MSLSAKYVTPWSRALLLLVAIGLAWGAGAQEVVTAPMDTAVALVKDTVAASPPYGPSSLPARPQRRSMPGALRSSGSLAVGVGIGQAPFTLPDDRALNGTLEGYARVVAAGIPIRIDVNGGTARPVRGSPWRVRVSFDRDALTLHNSVDETVALDHARRSIDSLQQRVALLQGERVRLDQLPPQPSSPSLEGPPIDTGIVALPGLPSDTLSGPAVPPSPAIAMRPEEVARRKEGLEHRIGAAQLMLDSLKQVEQRLNALVNARKEAPHGLADELAALSALEIGECHSSSTQYLVRDISVQGGHIQLKRDAVYGELLYGRSLDDAWRATQANGRLVDALQQASLFLPARDLNPRRLGMAMAGYGDPSSGHIQLGVLYGTKYLAAPGAPVPDGAPQLRDLVVELNTAYRLWKRYEVYAVLAGSSTAGSDGLATPVDPDRATTLIGRSGRSLAATIGSRVELGRTRVELEARAVGPEFFSLGLGYLRSGSRSLSASCSLRPTEKVELRVRGVWEHRDAIGGGALDVQRGQCNLTYRPSRKWSLLASVQPAVARATALDGTLSTQRNWVVGGGVNYRARVRHTVITATSRVDRYRIAVPDTLAPTTWWATASSAAQWRNGAEVGATLAGPLATGGQGTGTQLALNVAWPILPKLRFDAHVTGAVGDPSQANYGAGLKRQLSGRSWCDVRVEHYTNGDVFFPSSLASDQVTPYYWRIRIGYDW